MRDEKYVVLRRDKLPIGSFAILGEGDKTNIIMSDAIVRDAVVIRRQDKFASPCLAIYAACIASSPRELPDFGT